MNSKDEVLMLQEKVSPDAVAQGLWKLPGGLADPAEDLGATAAREVLEETGISAEFVGVVSMRHSHNRRFGQGDLYFVVKMRALSEDIQLDGKEIADAKWMSMGDIAARVHTGKPASTGEGALSGCVTDTTFKIIEQALGGPLIAGAAVTSILGSKTMLYAASDLAAPKL